LDKLGRAGLYRVVLLHHPPAAGVVSRRKALVDEAGLRRVLASRGAELVLHGHAHEATMSSLPGPRGPIPALGVPSASAAADGHGPPARWHAVEIDLDGEAPSVRIVARGFAPGADHIEELGRYIL
jgi:3',5'-cyclic AMP phosphodiesterase CpdA